MINQNLLDRIEDKLGIGRARVYAKIQAIANKHLIESNEAALLLATENGIGIKRYSTPEERANLRGTRTKGAQSGEVRVPGPQVAAKMTRRNTPPAARKAAKTNSNSVFVVHGRDEALRKSMFEFLRAIGLNPLEWERAVLMGNGANPNIGDVLDVAMNKVQAVVVMFSPDDLAMLDPRLQKRGEKSTEGKLQGQPRANVLFEAGMALGHHPGKTLIVEVGKVRGFSDIAGKHIVRLSNDTEKRLSVANRLEKIGCQVDTKGRDWIHAGDFSVKPAKRTPKRK